MRSSVLRPSSPPTPQSLQSRDYPGTDIQNNGSNNNIIITSGNNNNITIAKVINTEGEDVELDRLLDGSISKDALHSTFDALPECHPGTLQRSPRCSGSMAQQGLGNQ
ncbi:hypothetical protein M378DRAFT_13283 [Amanita muscaria Koide BX008]|uniref:Uncharacterized protein n=1 Tax=Amanita muscaria (strain Koide BX008) TaxID=946122 RepID=A0A0C2WJT4_AMAMK|nr:hypothetical protein M378DRAFT_13283 [Amanita muscaria Koide BX008]